MSRDQQTDAIGRVLCWLGRHEWVEISDTENAANRKAVCTREHCDEQRTPLGSAGYGAPDYPEEFK